MNTLEELKSYKYDKAYIVEQLQNKPHLKKLVDNVSYNGGEVNFNTLRLNDYDINDLKHILNILNKQKGVEDKIDSLKQPYRNLLYYKYVLNYEIKVIASKMDISNTRVYQLHKEAIELYIKL